MVFLKNTNIKIAESAIKISEVLLMNGLIPLNDIYDLIVDLYNYMNKQDRLDAFCRILGILIFNCNKIDYKQIFKNKHYSYIEPLVKITIKNKLIYIHFNDFFERIIMKLNKRFNFTQKLADDTSVNNNFFPFIFI